MDTGVPTGQIIHQQSPPQALRFSHGFVRKEASAKREWLVTKRKGPRATGRKFQRKRDVWVREADTSA